VTKILLVEDDKDLATVITEWLIGQKFSIDIAYDGREGYEYLQQGHYEVVILDWDLPGMSGLEICRRHRLANGLTPILMLTGKDQIIEKEQGFEAGADDYLTKPFNMRELSARLKALSRRPPTAATNVLKIGDLALDPTKHKILKAGKEIHLLPKDFSLLEFLMRHPEEIFSSEVLLQNVWNFDTDATPDAVRTSVKRLRKMIDNNDDEQSSLIENVRRVGYRLKLPS
jgi:DNA-binding response OmpR family regulator